MNTKITIYPLPFYTSNKQKITIYTTTFYTTHQNKDNYFLYHVFTLLINIKITTILPHFYTTNKQ